MAANRTSIHGQWSSRWIFILAATGSAVGLGNIWRFPYITAEHGGGAFVLIYLVCIVLVGLPIMMSEIMLGRRGRRSPIHTMAVLAEEEGHSRHWRLVGVLGVFAGFFYPDLLQHRGRLDPGIYRARRVRHIYPGKRAKHTGYFLPRWCPTRSGCWPGTPFFMIMTVFVVSRGVKKRTGAGCALSDAGLVFCCCCSW